MSFSQNWDSRCDECSKNERRNNRSYPRSSIAAFQIYSSQTSSIKDNELKRLHQENQKLREDLRSALNSTGMGKDQQLHVRLANQLRRKAQKGGKFEDISCRCRSSDLIQAYNTLYSETRVEALEALNVYESDILNSEQLKSKLLFSIIVLAFRAAHAHSNELKSKLHQMLQVDVIGANAKRFNDDAAKSNTFSFASKKTTPSATTSVSLSVSAEEEIIECIETYLRKTVDTFNISTVIQSVEVQIWTTLHEHMIFLRECKQFLEYINQCCRTAWGLVNQTPPFLIEFRVRKFNQRVHERFHTSVNETSDLIQEYIWPALIDSGDMSCVSKAHVVTGYTTVEKTSTDTSLHSN